MKKAEILYCGHSAVIITTESGHRVAIDPFLTNNPTCPTHLHDPGQIDYILLTHGHGDHTGDVLQLAARYRSVIAATYELGSLLIRDGVPESQVVLMNKGGTAPLPHSHGLRVTLTNAFHSSSYTTKDGREHYAGEACGVVLHLESARTESACTESACTESARTVYHAGDTCLFGDMKLIGEQYRPDVALLPIGDHFTMGPKEAAQALALIQPKAAIPIHYATFGLLTGTAEEFVEHAHSTPVHPLKPGETLRF